MQTFSKLKEAERKLIISNHLLQNIYPLTLQKKLLLNILENVKNSLEILTEINPILKKEKTILEIFRLSNFQKNSTMEFKRKEKVVILSKNLEFETINKEKLQEFIKLSKKALIITRLKISEIYKNH